MSQYGQEYIHYPNGQVSVKGSPLLHADSGEFRLTNNAKHRPTLHNPASGFTTGPQECSGQMKITVPKGGLPVKYAEAIKNPEQVPFVFKDAAARHRIVGIYQELQSTSDIGNGGVEYTISWIGRHIKES